MKDLSHHLNETAKLRKDSPLKSLWKYMIMPGMLQLGGGAPHPRNFPYEEMGALLQAPTGLLPGGNSDKLVPLHIKKYGGDVDLATALQYSASTGLEVLARFVKEFTALAFRPAMAEWDTLLTCGNTDGFHKAMQLFAKPGDNLLVEEFTYPSMMECARPLGVSFVPVELDEQGLSAQGLEHVLSTWDSSTRGPRPHMLYTVPIGQNPTGTVMRRARRKALYDICAKYDVLIIEDDPYYFLQLNKYDAEARGTAEHLLETPELDDLVAGRIEVTPATIRATASKYLDKLEGSFLQYDVDGRVFRLDTFSKIVAPGSRLGWATASPMFIERLLRTTETTTQCPSGFAMAMVYKMAHDVYGMAGWLQWLQGIRAEYERRRNLMVSLLEDEFRPAVVVTDRDASEGWLELVHETLTPRLVSYVIPDGGMFIWIRIHLEHHPRYGSTPLVDLMDEIFDILIAQKILVVPGKFFAATPEIAKDRSNYFRLTFAAASDDDTREAIHRVGVAVHKFFE